MENNPIEQTAQDPIEQTAQDPIEQTAQDPIEQTAHRGAFIVFEGIDRCGKSTQVKKLKEYFDSVGIHSVVLRFPDRESSTGKVIDEYLKGAADIDTHVLHLLFSANRWEKAKLIEKLLLEGTTVIVDRYAFSGTAYTVAKYGSTKYEDVSIVDDDMFSWCNGPDSCLPSPDILIYLDIDPKQAATRGNYGEERYERVDFQQRVYHMFERIREYYDWWVTWLNIDASKSADDVGREIIRNVEKLADDVCNKPVRCL